MKYNREEIIKALECHASGKLVECERCPLDKAHLFNATCVQVMCENALALIKELTEDNEKFRYEHGKLIEQRDTFREYAYNMQKYVENIRHKEEDGYEPSAARYAAEMDMWSVVALEKKKLIEENERLEKELAKSYDALDEQMNFYCSFTQSKIQNCPIDDEVAKVKADTVRKIQDRLAMHFGTYTDKTEVKVVDVFKLVGQIAEDMLEENNV